MNSKTRKSSIAGSAGALEIAVDLPAGVSRGFAVIAHPHPLYGGTLDNKVVQTLARAFVQTGWTAVRFNFRGVGGSAGSHDEGRGELDDFLAVVQHAAPAGEAQAVLALAGFSFGAFVATHAFARLQPERQIDKLVLVGEARGDHGDDLPIHRDRRMVIEYDDAVAAMPQTLPPCRGYGQVTFA